VSARVLPTLCCFLDQLETIANLSAAPSLPPFTVKSNSMPAGQELAYLVHIDALPHLWVLLKLLWKALKYLWNLEILRIGMYQIKGVN